MAITTRRGLIVGAALGVPLAGTAGAVLADVTESDETRLRAALAAADVAGPHTSLTLVRFAARRSSSGGTWHLTATVRMTWPPGIRQRRFEMSHPDADQALAQLLEQILVRFRAIAAPAAMG